MNAAEDLHALKEKELQIKAELLKRLARESLLGFTLYTKPDYQVNWHHRIMCEKLDKFARKEIKRLMIFMPPRYGKSEMVSRRLPAFILGRNPNASIISASYSADLASMMNRDVQRCIDSEAYQELFPRTKLASEDRGWKRTNDLFEVVGHRGLYRSAGVGGGLTGFGTDYALIDDPLRNQEDADSDAFREKLAGWFSSTLMTRLEKNGSVLITMTRWRADDLCGTLLDLAKSNPEADQWEVISFPAVREDLTNSLDPRELGEALWPEKYPVEALTATRATLGSRTWAALYQQRPSVVEGGIFKREWWKFYTSLPEKFDEVIQSWDMAFKDTKNSDYVVGQVWGRKGANRYLLHQVRARMDFPTTIRAVRALSERYPLATLKLIGWCKSSSVNPQCERVIT